MISGKSPFGLIDLSALQEGMGHVSLDDMNALDQSLPPQMASNAAQSNHPQQMSPGTHLAGFERYSRKVFVGGLPPDIDEGASNMCVSLSRACVFEDGDVHYMYMIK